MKNKRHLAVHYPLQKVPTTPLFATQENWMFFFLILSHSVSGSQPLFEVEAAAAL